MESERKEVAALYLVGGTGFRVKRVQRAAPKHLRRTLQNIAALEFQRLESPASAAKSIREPGITERTVHECATLNLLRRMEKVEAFLSMNRGLAA